MILELLLKLVFGVINLLLALVPTISLPVGFTSLLSTATDFLAMGSYFLPVASVVGCFTLIFIVDNIKFIMSIVNWLISKIPTIS